LTTLPLVGRAYGGWGVQTPAGVTLAPPSVTPVVAAREGACKYIASAAVTAVPTFTLAVTPFVTSVLTRMTVVDPSARATNIR